MHNNEDCLSNNTENEELKNKRTCIAYKMMSHMSIYTKIQKIT